MTLTRYTVSDTALQDIDEIIRYVFPENPQAAIELECNIYEAFELIADNPAIGHLRSDLTDQIYRFWTVQKPYLIVYAEDTPPRIIRVLNGYRDVATILFE